MSNEILLADLESAIAWVASFGVSPDASLRFERYRRAMTKMNQFARAGDRENVNALYGSAANALFEALSLIEIWHKLSGDECRPFVKDRLDFIRGPDHAGDENPARSTNTPRNKQFELVIAGTVPSADRVHLELGERFSEIDVPLQTKYGTLFVECKRPVGERGVEDRYDEAHSKLRDRMESFSDMSVRGVIAIDLTKLANPRGALLWTDFAKAEELCSRCIYGFLESNRRLWAKPRKSPLTIGTLIRVMQFVVSPESPRPFTYYNRFGVGNLKETTPDDQLWLDELHASLEDSHRNAMWMGLMRGYGSPLII